MSRTTFHNPMVRCKGWLRRRRMVVVGIGALTVLWFCAHAAMARRAASGRLALVIPASGRAGNAVFEGGWGRLRTAPVYLAHPAPQGRLMAGFNVAAAAMDCWMATNGLSASSAEFIRSVSERRGNTVSLPPALTIANMGVRRDRLIAARFLSWQCSLTATLDVPRKGDLKTVVEYWGAGGNSEALRGLLERNRGRSVPIAELLPPTPRLLLHSFPGRDSEQNCAWSSLSFFEPHPIPAYCGFEELCERLERGYREVEGERRFGDILLVSVDAQPVHVVVHVAGPLVFSKPGLFAAGPWKLETLEDSIAPHARRDLPAPVIQAFRRRGI